MKMVLGNPTKGTQMVALLVVLLLVAAGIFIASQSSGGSATWRASVCTPTTSCVPGEGSTTVSMANLASTQVGVSSTGDTHFPSSTLTLRFSTVSDPAHPSLVGNSGARNLDALLSIGAEWWSLPETSLAAGVPLEAGGTYLLEFDAGNTLLATLTINVTA